MSKYQYLINTNDACDFLGSVFCGQEVVAQVYLKHFIVVGSRPVTDELYAFIRECQQRPIQVAVRINDGGLIEGFITDSGIPMRTFKIDEDMEGRDEDPTMIISVSDEVEMPEAYIQEEDCHIDPEWFEKYEEMSTALTPAYRNLYSCPTCLQEWEEESYGTDSSSCPSCRGIRKVQPYRSPQI